MRLFFIVIQILSHVLQCIHWIPHEQYLGCFRVLNPDSESTFPFPFA
jgi:hypothetical protein